ncbi:MAG: hypothetical protein KAT81_01050 [Syntrophobacterales bacterium]|nr:hypothetical protein [Syntrophobacterales bacterium]
MKRYFSLIAGAGIAALILIFLFSCAPVNLYTINMNYTPSETAEARAADTGNVQLTVARFIDSRSIKDKMIIGRVVSPDGGTIPVLPKYLKPVDAVTAGIRECLSAAGYSLSPEIPVWDLRSDSIDKKWGTVLIGGTIDKLEVVCHKDGIKKKYRANVKLTIVFADARNARIFRKMEIETSPSLVHVRFSEKMLEEQINKALSASIERVFGNRETMQKIIGETAGK